MHPELILNVTRSAGRQLKGPMPNGEYVTQCPFPEKHRNGDANPSCRLNPKKGTCYCDVCGFGGGVKKLAEALGVDLKKLTSHTGSTIKASLTRDTRLALAFHPAGPIRESTQQHLAERLGKAYQPETWAAFGVVEGEVWPEGKAEAAEPCIAFPQPDGGFHVYRYRRAPKNQRWRFPKGSRPNLITAGLDRADPVILAEGEWDGMTAYELGFPTGTGTGGCAHWDTERYAEPLRSRLVAVVYDVDGPGRSGVGKPLQGLRGIAKEVVDILLPLSGKDGKDLTDYVHLHGGDAFRQLLQASTERLKANRGCACVAASPSAQDLLRRMEERFPGTGGPLRAGLALHAYLCFSGDVRPCALFIAGPGSSGKTLVVRMFLPMPGETGLDSFVYRCDSFTPASFVSRAANIKPERLCEIDLLPKLANKVLVTKELAPVFRGKDEDLIQTFAILTSVLDGDGYMVAGGSVGTRGYSEDIFFCWLGATTPFSPRTWRTMASLGPRILFYTTDAHEPSIDDLVRCQEEDSQEERLMRFEVNSFLKHFFESHPPRSVPLNFIACSEGNARTIALHARFIARLRAGLSLQESPERGQGEARYAPPQKEHEYRLAKTLNVLARGSALALGRREVTDEDLGLLQHIAFSSAPEARRQVAMALIELTRAAAGAGGRWPIEIPIREIASKTGASLPTVRHYAEELQVLKVARYGKAEIGDPGGSTLSLVKELVEMIEEPDTHNPNSLSTSAPHPREMAYKPQLPPLLVEKECGSSTPTGSPSPARPLTAVTSVTRLLEMSLLQLERDGRPLQVRVPWLADTLWFVPGPLEGSDLVEKGIPRGRIWTAAELTHLLKGPGLTSDAVASLGRAKALFGGDLLQVQEWDEPELSCYSCKGSWFWRSKDGAIICATCHPPADRALTVAWLERLGKPLRPNTPRHKRLDAISDDAN